MSSGNEYLHQEPDGRIKLYRRPDNPKYIQAAIIVRGMGRAMRFSTGKVTLELALEEAKRRLRNLEYRIEQGLAVGDILLSAALDQWLEHKQAQLENGEISKHEYQNCASGLKHIRSFFIEKEDLKYLKDIKQDHISKFKSHLTRTKKIKSWWHNKILSILGQIYQLCIERKQISEKPIIKNEKTKEERRYGLSESQWQTLKSKLDSWVEIELNKRNYWYRKVTRDYIIFMVHSGLRPSEAQSIRFEDIVIRERETDKQYRISDISPSGEITNEYAERFVTTVKVPESTKTGKRDNDCQPAALLPLKRRWEARESRPSDHVFSNPDGTRIRGRMRSTQNAFKYAGVATHPNGHVYGNYSLRHTYFTFMIRQSKNLSLDRLAANGGTSIKMLKQHYWEVKEGEFYEHALTSGAPSEF